MNNATIGIEGMTCGGCVSSVKRVLERAPGVEVLAVEVGEVKVRFDPAQVDEARLRSLIERAGFTPTEFEQS